MEKGKPYLLLLLVRAVACSVAAATVAVAAAFAAMRTAAFTHGGVLSVAVCVRMSFAVVLTAVAMTLAVAVLTFARAVRMGAAMAAFGVLMSLAVMRAVCLRRIVKRTGEMLCDSLVRRALDAGIDADAGIRERLDRARADAAADQHIDLMRLQKFRKRTVTAALCADDLRPLDRIVLDIVELECLRMTEVLKHRAIFIFIGDCNSHCIFSFPAGG